MGKTEPLRKCIGCEEMIGKKGLLRIVKDKDNNFFLDPTGKKNGRGAYICNDIKCFEAARKKKAFERSFKCKIPDEIFEKLKHQIENGNEESGTNSKSKESREETSLQAKKNLNNDLTTEKSQKPDDSSKANSEKAEIKKPPSSKKAKKKEGG